MAEEDVSLVFPGHTALLRARRALLDRAIPCGVRAAPAGASPCGWALSVQISELARATALLSELGVPATVLLASSASQAMAVN